MLLYSLKNHAHCCSLPACDFSPSQLSNSHGKKKCVSCSFPCLFGINEEVELSSNPSAHNDLDGWMRLNAHLILSKINFAHVTQIHQKVTLISKVELNVYLKSFNVRVMLFSPFSDFG